MNNFKFVKWIVSGVIAVLAIVCLFYLVITLRGCKHMVEDVTKPFEKKADQSFINPETGEPVQPVKSVIKQRWIGQDDEPRLEITIPPSEDTTKLWIPGGEKVYVIAGEDSAIKVVKINPALIRLKPSLHVCAIYNFKTVGFGIKIRALEIWRFGIAGYFVDNMGFGAGVDLRLISNVSIDAVRFLDGFGCGMSLRL